MKPGEIWTVRVPELGTHEQSGMRPSVVIARVTKTIVTIIPCTTNRKALRFPFTCAVEPTAQNGMTDVSIALVFHLRAIDASCFSKKLGELDRETFAHIRKQAHQLIGE